PAQQTSSRTPCAHWGNPSSECSRHQECTRHRHSRSDTRFGPFPVARLPLLGVPPSSTTAPSIARLRCHLDSLPELSSSSPPLSDNHPSCSKRLPIRARAPSDPAVWRPALRVAPSPPRIFPPAKACAP